MDGLFFLSLNTCEHLAIPRPTLLVPSRFTSLKGVTVWMLSNEGMEYSNGLILV